MPLDAELPLLASRERPEEGRQEFRQGQQSDRRLWRIWRNRVAAHWLTEEGAMRNQLTISSLSEFASVIVLECTPTIGRSPMVAKGLSLNISVWKLCLQFLSSRGHSTTEIKVKH